MVRIIVLAFFSLNLPAQTVEPGWQLDRDRRLALDTARKLASDITELEDPFLGVRLLESLGKIVCAYSPDNGEAILLQARAVSERTPPGQLFVADALKACNSESYPLEERPVSMRPSISAPLGPYSRLALARARELVESDPAAAAELALHALPYLRESTYGGGLIYASLLLKLHNHEPALADRLFVQAINDGRDHVSPAQLVPIGKYLFGKEGFFVAEGIGTTFYFEQGRPGVSEELARWYFKKIGGDV